MRERKAEKIVLEEIRRDGEKLCIPKSLEPERMEESLKEHERKRFFLRGRLYPALAGAACVCLIGGALRIMLDPNDLVFVSVLLRPLLHRQRIPQKLLTAFHESCVRRLRI